MSKKKQKKGGKIIKMRKPPGPAPEMLHIPQEKLQETIERLVGKRPPFGATGSMDVQNTPKPK
ncbi:MAG: hypothetical protein HY286_18135 [Planctomycetes bacterium]|nr:hypothetical protein [Planctomycetota bacterium]